MRKCHAVTVSLVMAIMTATICAADDLEAVEKTIASLNDKMTSYTAKIDMTSGVSTLQAHGTGTLQCLRTGDKLLYRMELANKPKDGPEQKVLGVFDGTDLYSQSEVMGQAMVIKMKPSFRTGIGVYSGQSMFDQLHTKFDVKLLPEENVDGKPAYVIEGTPKADADLGKQKEVLSRLVFFFLKDSGVQAREVTYDKAGNATMTINYKDIQPNADVKAEVFNYKPPANARVLNEADFKKMLPKETQP